MQKEVTIYGKVKLVTRHGYEFWYESFLTVNGKDCPTSEMIQEQRHWVFAQGMSMG